MFKLNPEQIKRNTYYSTLRYTNLKKHLNDFELDLYEDQRLKKQECKTCYYLKNSMAGQAFTKYACGNCGKEQMYHNTNTPRYCEECAKEFNVCIRCGAELK